MNKWKAVSSTRGEKTEWELFDLKRDPGQLKSVTNEEAYMEVLGDLRLRLAAGLEKSGDPRSRGEGDFFDQVPYLGGGPKHPSLR